MFAKNLVIFFLLFLFFPIQLFPQEGISINIKAPEFKLKSIKGEEASLSYYINNKIIIIHFWKTNWRECRAEFPHLKKIFEENKSRDIEIISIDPIDKEGKVKSDAEYFELPYPVLIGRDSNIIENYNLIKLPWLLILDKTGKIIFSEKFAKYEKIKEELEKVKK